MKNRAIIPLVVGLAVGLVAVKLSVDVVQKARAGSTEDMLSIVVAQQMIPMGVEIKPGMLSISRSSKGLSPQGAYEDPKKLVGRVVRSPVAKGMPIIEEMLAAPGTPAGMASLVPAGYRAVAVRVEEETSVAGFLKPGCRVDVAAILNVRGSNGASQTISKVLLQDVTVGAVGQSLTGDTESSANLSRSVTLLVKPDEVPVLHLAATQGKIRLAMRHFEDMGEGQTGVARESDLDPDVGKEADRKDGGGLLSGLASLFHRQEPAAGPAPKPAWVEQLRKQGEPTEVTPPHVVMVMQGGNVESIAFENASSMQRVNPGRLSRAALASAVEQTPAKGGASARTATPAEAAPVGPEAQPSPAAQDVPPAGGQ